MEDEKKDWTIPEFTNLVIDQAQTVLQRFGEWGDRDTELGIIRKAEFAIPKQEAVLRVHEVVDPETMWDRSSPLAYNILRDDWRGSYDILLTVRPELGARALMALNYDLLISDALPEHYAKSDNADEYKRRYPDGYRATPRWPTLHEDEDFLDSPLKVPHRSILTADQYKAGLIWHSRGEPERSAARVLFEPEKYLRNF